MHAAADPAPARLNWEAVVRGLRWQAGVGFILGMDRGRRGITASRRHTKDEEAVGQPSSEAVYVSLRAMDDTRFLFVIVLLTWASSLFKLCFHRSIAEIKLWCCHLKALQSFQF